MSGPGPKELTELALSDIARRRDFAEGDMPLREEGGPQDATEVLRFRDFGDEVTLSTVFGWS
jgi:hypothetical protein